MFSFFGLRIFSLLFVIILFFLTTFSTLVVAQISGPEISGTPTIDCTNCSAITRGGLYNNVAGVDDTLEVVIEFNKEVATDAGLVTIAGVTADLVYSGTTVTATSIITTSSTQGAVESLVYLVSQIQQGTQ